MLPLVTGHDSPHNSSSHPGSYKAQADRKKTSPPPPPLPPRTGLPDVSLPISSSKSMESLLTPSSQTQANYKSEAGHLATSLTSQRKAAPPPPCSSNKAHPLPASTVKLSLKALTLLKWKDGEKVKIFRLVDEVSTKWQLFGTLIGLSANKLQVWEKENTNNITMCCNKVMEHWLLVGGSRDYPTTWEGLYTLLEDAELSEVANSLKKAVDCSATKSA